MVQLLYLLSFVQAIWAQSNAVNVADVPQCAKDCLTNSTAVVAKTCGTVNLNVACLCNSPEFVSTFYCCLSTQCNTSEQAVAITFNEQQCAAVNTTAPDFVGCSPLKATSTAGIVKTATTVTPSNGGPYSTVASIVSEPATYSASDQVTTTFAGQALLTGSCTAPLFALVSASSHPYLFPQVGCAPNRLDCCPFDVNANAAITMCPPDYFTTANGCCPSGYQLYPTAIGADLPCYSSVSTILIPASTPSITGLTIITDHVFSTRYTLSQAKPNSLSSGAIAGIVVVAVVCIAITAAILWWIRRERRTQLVETGTTGSTFPPEEPVMPPQPDMTSPQELASTEGAGFKSPTRSFWPGGAFSSQTYRREKILPSAKSIAPQELPGSTYMNEHHPAFTESETATEVSAMDRTPRTPARSPVTSTAASPLVTPVPDDRELRAMSPGVVSPLGSPRLPRAATEHSVISDRD